jgi:hypothetical protein
MTWFSFVGNGRRTTSDLRHNATATLVIGLIFVGAIAAFALWLSIDILFRPVTVYRDRHGETITRDQLPTRFPDGYSIMQEPLIVPLDADNQLLENVDRGPHWSPMILEFLVLLILSGGVTVEVARELRRRWRHVAATSPPGPPPP